MDAHTLTAWTRFALQKGGIGSCTAMIDNPATEPEDLMFMTGEKIIVLRRLDEEGTEGERRASTSDSNSWFLGYCEGVVGRFKGAHVQFHGKLKKPVLMRRSGASSSGHGHNSALFPARDSSGSALSPTSPSSSQPRLQGAISASSSRSSANGLTIPPRSGSSLNSSAPSAGPSSSATVPASQQQQQGKGAVTAPLAFRRPLKQPNGALQTQAARRMELTTPPLSDENHQDNGSTDTALARNFAIRSNNQGGIPAPPMLPQAEPSADVQAAGESFRRRVADTSNDDDADSDDSTSMLPWARARAGEEGGATAGESDDDDDDERSFALSRSAPGSTRNGVRTPEHPNAYSNGGGGGGARTSSAAGSVVGAAPDMPPNALANALGARRLQQQQQMQTPVKGGAASEQQRTLAKLTTNGLPPSPISSADSPSARDRSALTPTQQQLQQQQRSPPVPQMPASFAPGAQQQQQQRARRLKKNTLTTSVTGAYTIAAQSTASNVSSAATSEDDYDDEEEEEVQSESAGSLVSGGSDSLSGSGHGAARVDGPASASATRLSPGAPQQQQRKYPPSANRGGGGQRRSPGMGGGRGGGGGARGKSGRDYAFSIYDLYGRDSVAFPNFEMHKEANRAMLASLADLGSDKEHSVETHGERERERTNDTLHVAQHSFGNGVGGAGGRISPGAESLRSTTSGSGRPHVRTPVGNRPMNPPPVTTPSVAAAMQQQEQAAAAAAARTLHLRSLSQKRPNHAPDPRKGSVGGGSDGTTMVAGGAPVPVPGANAGAGAGGGAGTLPTKSLASSLRRQVENSNGNPATALSSPTLSHTAAAAAGGVPPPPPLPSSASAPASALGSSPPLPPPAAPQTQPPSQQQPGAPPSISFDPHRRPSAPAAVGAGAGPSGMGMGMGVRPPMPGSFSGPSSTRGPPPPPGGAMIGGMMPPPMPGSAGAQGPGGFGDPQQLQQQQQGPPMPAQQANGGVGPQAMGMGMGLDPAVAAGGSLPPGMKLHSPVPLGPGPGPAPGMMMPMRGPGTPGPGPGPGAGPMQPGMMLPPNAAGGPAPPPSMMNGTPGGLAPMGPGFGPGSVMGGPPGAGGPGPGAMLSRTPSPMVPGSPAFGAMQIPGAGPGARGSGGPMRAASDRTPDRESGRGSALLKKNPSNPNPSGSRGSGFAPIGAVAPLPGGGPALGPMGPPGGLMSNTLAPMMRPGGHDLARSPSSFAPSNRSVGAPSMRSVQGAESKVLNNNPVEAAAAAAVAVGPPLAFDASGFIVGSQPAAPGAMPVPEDRDVIDKWDAILREGDLVAAKKSRKVKKMTQSGIPNSMRAAVWLWLSNSAVRRRPGLFEQLCKQSQEKKARKGKEAVYEAIEKDVDRCFPDHRLFIGKDSPARKDLEAILKAYALFNPVVGYTQGMGLIVGLYLMYMPAEDAFWLLCALLRDVHMEGYYTDNMKQLHVDGVVFGQLLQSMDPEVHARLTAWGIEPINYVPNWFLPMFTRILPWETMMRVWDTFFFEGPIWIVRISLAIIRIIREPLMACKDYDSALTLLLHPPSNNLTPDNVLGCALSVKLKDGEVRKLSRTASKLVRQSNALNDRGRSASRATDRNSVSLRSMSMPAKR